MPDHDCFSKRLGPFFQKAARLARDGAEPTAVRAALAKAVSILMRKRGYEMPMLKPMLAALERAVNRAVRQQNDFFQTPDVRRAQFLAEMGTIAHEHVGHRAFRLVEEAGHAAYEKLSGCATFIKAMVKGAMFAEVTERLLEFECFSKGREGIAAGRDWNDEQFDQFKAQTTRDVAPQISNLLEQALRWEDGKPRREARKPRSTMPERPVDIHASLEIGASHEL